jgi:hypothetical protein
VKLRIALASSAAYVTLFVMLTIAAIAAWR